MNTMSTSFFYGFTKGKFVILTISLATVIEILQKIVGIYIWSDWKFVGFLFTLIIIDTITGMISSVMAKGQKITSKRMAGMPIKVVLYFCYLVSINVALNFTIEGEKSGVFDFLKTVLYAYPVCRELLSIDENLLGLGYSIFPNALRSKISEFINSKNEENQNRNKEL